MIVARNCGTGSTKARETVTQYDERTGAGFGQMQADAVSFDGAVRHFDRHGAPPSLQNSETPQEIDHRRADLRCALLLGPVTATRQHDGAAQLGHKAREVRD
jgi:hypothetical protein